jgi:hypothetical protein
MWTVLLGACFGLAACASDGKKNNPPAPASPAQNFDTAEFNKQSGLNQIDVLPAYERDALGQGVIVAIIDTGIDLDNPEFADRIHPNSADLVAPGIVSSGDLRPGGPNLQDQDNHGTPVAGIIGAAKNNAAIHGVAPEATLLIFRADDETDDETILGPALGEGVVRAAQHNAHVLNLSLGSDDAGARASFASIFQFTKDHDIVSVISAGNDGAAEPDESALGALDVPGDPATIVAGAVGSGNVIAGFSNRAGSAADIFLVAPGVLINTIGVNTPNGQTELFSGTSASTPHVSGAAALLRSLWPQLSAVEIVEILLESATDLGDPGIDPVYGRGLLNVGAAVAPSGSVTSLSAGGSETEVTAIGASLSSVFGDFGATIGRIVVFDEYDRDFRLNFGDAINAAAPEQYDVEAALNPFDRRENAIQRIDGRSVAAYQLRSRDLWMTNLQARPADFLTGADLRNDLMDRSLALALTADMGAGRQMTIAQGFSSRAADQMTQPMRDTPFLNGSAFSDAFLPKTDRAVSGFAHASLTPRFSADLFMTSADDELDDGAAAFETIDAEPREDRRTSAVRAGLTWRTRTIALRLEQGLRQEQGTILKAYFGEGTAARTLYAAVEADLLLSPRWRAKGRFSSGYTMAQTHGLGDFVDGFSNLMTTQFSAALIRQGLFGASDQLWLGVSQPLQIESGAIRMTLPTDFDPYAETLTFTSVRAPLAPNGRRLDFEAGYRLFAGNRAAFDINVIHQAFGGLDAPALTTFVLRSGFQF